jgi:hypothetical protein
MFESIQHFRDKFGRILTIRGQNDNVLAIGMDQPASDGCVGTSIGGELDDSATKPVAEGRACFLKGPVFGAVTDDYYFDMT